MISSRSFFSSILLGALLCALGGCARPGGAAPSAEGGGTIAVLPLDNLSGGSIPSREIRRELIATLAARGAKVLDDDALEAFMASHRVRYSGGVDRETAEAFGKETGVDAILITSVELYNESIPPRIALTARLVVAGKEPRIRRVGNAALAGDDSPGLFGLGLVNDPKRLRAKALDRLVAALLEPGPVREKGAPFKPVSLFRARPLAPEKESSVVVLPFLNRSGRRYAGEILALHFIDELWKRGVTIVEPGVVRQELLRYRVIMEEGVSLSDAQLVFNTLNVDYILAGSVSDYDDAAGSFGTPRVDFSALLLDRDTRKTVWDAGSRYSGDDRVHFFDIGRISTANGLAAAMVRGAVATLY